MLYNRPFEFMATQARGPVFKKKQEEDLVEVVEEDDWDIEIK